MQSRNHLIFALVVLLLLIAYWQFNSYLFPPRKPVAPPSTVVEKKEEPKPAPTPGRLPPLPAETPENELISLGVKDDYTQTDFELFVTLDPLAGGIRSVRLNKFKAATKDGQPTNELLDLVPGKANSQVPAFALYHFPTDDPSAERPFAILGEVRWEVVKHDGKAVVEKKIYDKKIQEVSFRRVILTREMQQELQKQKETLRSKVNAGMLSVFGLFDDATEAITALFAKDLEHEFRQKHGIRLTKTFSLMEGDYHVGLKVDMERPASDLQKETVKFRYQLAGARGLPVEGKWYTHIFRNAYVGQDRGGWKERELQELRQISVWGGGDSVNKASDGFIRYAGVAVQYFASVIVVDNKQQEGENQEFIRSARPTLETGVIRGRIKSRGANYLVVVPDGGKSEPETIYLMSPETRQQAEDLKPDQPVAIVFQPLNYNAVQKTCPRVAISIRTGEDVAGTHAVWEDDITIRVNTEPVDLAPGAKKTHKYLLYHGPVKPSLLQHLKGDRKVNYALIDRYAYTLGLNTMLDSPSTAIPFGPIGKYTGFSWLVIYCTNIIHRVLGWMTWINIPYGISILLLTILVRGMMFPLSRKQAMMGIKMQELAPEVKAIGEKYKDDQQAKGQAMMELYRKNGVNPLGSCWVMLLQMPVFMGLYYALQESILFRLAPFWGTWIHNLAAPDMLIGWTRHIPMLSTDASYGGFLYLGPYLNVLPIVAVVLMLIQQKMMTPPPADEQQEVQQKMMKWMMGIMCLLFYKVAAGLCIYFIASSLWGFAERKLLPKAKKPSSTPSGTPALATVGASSDQITSAAKTNSSFTQSKKPGRNKRKDGPKAKEEKTGLSKIRQQVSDWWNDILDKAKKK